MQALFHLHACKQACLWRIILPKPRLQNFVLFQLPSIDLPDLLGFWPSKCHPNCTHVWSKSFNNCMLLSWSFFESPDYPLYTHVHLPPYICYIGLCISHTYTHPSRVTAQISLSLWRPHFPCLLYPLNQMFRMVGPAPSSKPYALQAWFWSRSLSLFPDHDQPLPWAPYVYLFWIHSGFFWIIFTHLVIMWANDDEAVKALESCGYRIPSFIILHVYCKLYGMTDSSSLIMLLIFITLQGHKYKYLSGVEAMYSVVAWSGSNILDNQKLAAWQLLQESMHTAQATHSDRRVYPDSTCSCMALKVDVNLLLVSNY